MTAAAVLDDAFATEIDAFAYGEYQPTESWRPSSFTGRIESSPAPGRYHLYVSWASIPSHHIAILRALQGLEDVVSLSYVDSLRDGRGWAFRSRTGPDPVNGFTLLRQAYEASAPRFAGDVRVPVLWDRRASAIGCDDPELIAADLLAAVGTCASLATLATGALVDAEVERLTRLVAGDLNAVLALRDPGRRPAFRRALLDLDRRLATRRYLVADRLSDADVRLWVRLARLDAGPNASGAIGPRLDQYPNLWRWATMLYSRPAFAANTDFRRFAAPFAVLAPWSLDHNR